jgi:2-polyprenyl-3-methyl-5-hydroxy-6-metoxy-1,4-benzoquinol methylase
MAALIPASAHRILDIGCGAGEFGAALKKDRRIEVVGIEVESLAASHAELRLDRVISTPVEEVDFRQLGRFDCVVLNDVIEHLPEPWVLLTRLRELIDAESKLIASIPNVRSFPVLFDLIWKGEWEYRSEGVLDRTHLRFFTKKSIRNLFEDAGYTIDLIQEINFHGMPFPMRLLNRVFSGKFYDMSFPQIAVVASRSASSEA